MANKREVWIDALRAFACICVLLVHAPTRNDGQIGGAALLGPVNFLFMAWGVAVFFMISGALLFGKTQEMLPFYKKRFSRILVPTVIWSVIYIFYDDFFIEPTSSKFHRILMIPFTNQTALVWFMYTLIGIYLVTPIVSCWLSNCKKRDVEIILILWGITLLMPVIKLLDPNCALMISGNGVFYHFYGFLGYALWGYYLRKYVELPIKSWKFFVLVLVAFGLPCCIYIVDFLPMDLLQSLMSIVSAVMATVAFIFFKDLNYKENWVMSFIHKFAEFSFGIYLCHMLFLMPLRYGLTQFHINYAVQIPLTALFVGGFSFLFVYFLSKLPKSRWLFG